MSVKNIITVTQNKKGEIKKSQEIQIANQTEPERALEMEEDLNFVFEEYGTYFAVLGSQGDRPGMEDAFSKFSSLPGVDNPNIFGVFDGHGGPDCALYSKDALPQILSKHPELKTNPKRAIIESFLEVDHQYCKLARKSTHLDDGTTAALLYVAPTYRQKSKRRKIKFFLASCGDSRSVLLKKNGDVVPLSVDHDLKRNDEADRIRAAGGTVRKDDYGSRVVSDNVGELAVTRAIGDVDFKGIGVIAEPEIYEGYLDDTSSYIIMASDGLWNQISNQEIGKIVKNYPKGVKLAKIIEDLIRLAKTRDNDISNKFHEELSCDNVTVLGINVGTMVSKLSSSCDVVLQKQRARRKNTLIIKGLSPYGYASELLLWKNPLRSFFWVLVGSLIYFLTQVANYNLVSLFTVLILTQLMVDSFVVNFTPVLRKVGLVGQEFDSAIFLNQGRFITEEVIDRSSSLVSNEVKKFANSWKVMVYDASPERLLVAIRNISYCFTPFSFATLLYILFLSSFSLFVTYERNKRFLDKIHHKLLTVYYQALHRVKRSFR